MADEVEQRNGAFLKERRQLGLESRVDSSTREFFANELRLRISLLEPARA